MTNAQRAVLEFHLFICINDLILDVVDGKTIGNEN
jgi:hypothetical protein